MKLSKKDDSHIEEEVRKLELRIDTECSEYAILYKRTYLERLKGHIDRELSVIDAVDKSALRYGERLHNLNGNAIRPNEDLRKHIANCKITNKE